MKKHLLALVLCSCFAVSIFAQTADSAQITDAQIISIAQQRGIPDKNIPEFVRHYRNLGTSTHASPKRYQQPATPLNFINPGFETGDFTGWSGVIGDNYSSFGPLQNTQPGIYSDGNDQTLTDPLARHTIMTAASGLDSIGNFPIVPPNAGNFTARLGETHANYQGETLEQYFQVTPQKPYLILSFAVVLDDGGHSYGQSPYFYFSITDSIYNPILSRHDEVPSHLTSGYIRSSTDSAIWYLPWEIDTVSLIPYINHHLIISFTVAACEYGEHYGYCYVNVQDTNIVNTTSVDEINEAKATFHLFPNPSNGIFNIVCKENTSNEKPIIMDLSGRIVSANVSKSNSGWQIDMSEKAKGIYFVKILTKNGFATQRLIVE